MREILEFATTVQLDPSPLVSTTYLESATPPVTVGAVKEICSAELRGAAVTPVGVPGEPAGITTFESVDVSEIPNEVRAIAWNE